MMGAMPVDRGATILHVDLDAFFAAVEQRDRPELRGRPVIVGGAPGSRGVVSAASYEARRFGVRSAMPLRTAAALCPDGVFVPVRGDRYAQVSRAFMDILRRSTPLVEQISIDEAFLDVAGTFALQAIGRADRRARSGRPSGPSSASRHRSGVASTRLVAKIASDLRKPDGLVVVPDGTEAEFLAPLPIWRLWGVGEQTRRALADYGVQTIGDLAVLPSDVLRRRFGEHGVTLATRARGVDPTPVGNEDSARTVSHEHTFDRDTRDPEAIERTLLALAEGVGSRLRDGGVRAATVGVKIRDSQFSTHTRQRTLATPTDQVDDDLPGGTGPGETRDPGHRCATAGGRRLQPDGTRAAVAVPRCISIDADWPRLRPTSSATGTVRAPSFVPGSWPRTCLSRSPATPARPEAPRADREARRTTAGPAATRAGR